MIVLLVGVFPVFGQEDSLVGDWIRYKIDSNTAIMIAPEYSIQDTVALWSITATMQGAAMLVTRQPNEGIYAFNIDNADQLTQSYDAIQKSFIEEQRGTLIGQETIEKKGLVIRNFYFRAVVPDGEQLRHSSLLFLNDNVYILTFIEFEGDMELMTLPRNKFFSSLEILTVVNSRSQRSDALTRKVMDRLGINTRTLIIGSLVFVVLLTGVVIWIRRRKKPASQDGF